MARNNTVTITIVGDDSRFQSVIKSATGAADGMANKLKSAGDKMADVGKKMSAAITLPVVGAGVVAVKSASDLAETMSKTDNVFKDSAAGIQEWAKGAAKSFGQSRQEALDAASTFGNLFVQLGTSTGDAAKMSTQMTELASDFASFHNAAPTDVIDAMSAAFRGEFDAVQRFVPTINAAAVEQRALAMTGKESTSMLTAQEKALAVQKLMLEGAGDAMGDFDRTSEGAANKQRILTAEFKDAAANIGTQLMPIAQQLLGWVGGLVDKFSNLSPGVQKFIMIAAGVLAVLGPIVGVVGTLSTVLGFLAANPIVLVILAIAALVAGLVWAYNNVEWFRDGVQAAFRFLVGVGEWVGRAFATVWDGIVGGFVWVVNNIKRLANWIAQNAINPAIDGINLLIRGYNLIPGHDDVGMIPKIPVFHDGGTFRAPAGQREGLALLEDGEQVIPAGGGSGGNGGGTQVVINFNGVTTREAADQVVRALELHFAGGGSVGNGRGGSLRPA